MSNRLVEAQDLGHDLEDGEELLDVFQEEEEYEDDNSELQDQSTSNKADTGDVEEPELPEKFKGKSVLDIVKSYENLEREYGRKNNEVGELRKLADQLLKLERLNETKKDEAQDDTIDADSLIENPGETIRKVLENDPTIRSLKEAQIKVARDAAKKDFEAVYPNWAEVMSSPEFVEWVTKSPMRQRELVRADQEYDYETAADILNQFQELTAGKSADIEAEKQQQKDKREEDFKKVAGQKKSTNRPSSKKIYDREQLIQLKINNPSKYEQMWPEIELAYKENRVRSKHRT